MMHSMTGFARLGNGDDGGQWFWELRSVNGKGLDFRFRLPQGYEELDPKLRDIGRKYLFRGNCNFSLILNREGGEKVVRLNEAALKSAAGAYSRAAEVLEVEPPSLDTIMAVRGVLELVEPEEDRELVERRRETMLTDFETALKVLVDVRSAEGQRLTDLFGDYLVSISRLVNKAENSRSRHPEAIAGRLESNLKQLLGKEDSLDDNRLHQEAVMLATRADIEEEIQRLHTHVKAAHDLLEEKGPVGRKFDFLVQEFNREANTLCSKANADDITAAGLQLKVIIDQMREQIQNIE